MRVQKFSRGQILQEFRLGCQALAADNNRGFKKEFEELNDVGKDLPTRAGDSEVNREKNRYPFILPYDHCRVRLSIQNSVPHTDYINANFVPGGGSERDFICTQGPLHNTMADFWRMVWEQNVRIIVMVTALRHKDIVLCDKYWPVERGTVYHGLIQVTTMTCKQGPDYFITTINLRQRDCPTDRIITHYYYHSWPDRGIPKDSSSLCAFTDHVRLHLEGIPCLGPSVVHCSAGVGRSGTFVTLLWLMQLCARGIQPDIRSAVEDLRLHRMWMVQNLEQYIFVHQCLMQWLIGGAGRTTAGPQIQGAGSKINHPVQDQPQSSGQGERTGRRRQHRQRQKPPSEPQQNTIQQMLHPGNLLRRLLPSSSLLNPGSHTP
ncbi:receptor-type tyrosine-protein phosphatase V [Hippoglossus stenolepis]|uniref:receptor-type tyrosine-protein phosphatase V n=1 Tax=Hippoglossus stenolepis TaxID=195615 RepID=UPI00159BFBD6|nr:receptor-type tyrosine-protein phosphatase V [Hippoglossus stenolepis]XP_035014539.1 receptor-type tyrosine-protein phosphatase V [Hippoglossus stenolepis]XP_035014540.1 receptor-type tyrosine-protein phosphatase V [Hippoglossus stenolepis]XP_035014541.1 receptor-type tyrosine-protein phosphatase V [Hippoglossus stenolepis]